MNCLSTDHRKSLRRPNTHSKRRHVEVECMAHPAMWSSNAYLYPPFKVSLSLNFYSIRLIDGIEIQSEADRIGSHPCKISRDISEVSLTFIVWLEVKCEFYADVGHPRNHIISASRVTQSSPNAGLFNLLCSPFVLEPSGGFLHISACYWHQLIIIRSLCVVFGCFLHSLAQFTPVYSAKRHCITVVYVSVSIPSRITLLRRLQLFNSMLSSIS